jgi:hypothetical protein
MCGVRGGNGVVVDEKKIGGKIEGDTDRKMVKG